MAAGHRGCEWKNRYGGNGCAAHDDLFEFRH
jgi:hypothetical protein